MPNEKGASRRENESLSDRLRQGRDPRRLVVAAVTPSNGASRPLTYEEYRAVRAAMTVAQWERVQAKAKWEQMTPWAVLNEWPSLRFEERDD
jgi:hypothetical protein